MERSRPRRRRATLLLTASLLLLPVALPTPVAAIAVESEGGSAAVAQAVATAPGDANIKLKLLASGLSSPVYATAARDGSHRIFIVEQTGRIRILKNGHVLATPFLSLVGKVSRGSEQGLLGLAFHPNFAKNRKLYVDYTDVNGHTIIREYKASVSNPNVVDPGSSRLIKKIYQPYANHNGGMIAFGRDGYLYIGMGDGGGAGDPQNRAQSLTTLLGKMLRIDVNGTSSLGNYRVPASNPYVGRFGSDEIWQTGLRNPWRWSFDRWTGDMWIGDVGQMNWEEVDRAAGAGRGINWGWNSLEGTHCYQPSSGCDTSGKTMPLLEYGHASGRCVVTGGYVYRGSAIPLLAGGYVFADYCTGEIWVVPANASAPATKTLLLNTSLLISSFGENGFNELLVTDLQGRLYQIVKA